MTADNGQLSIEPRAVNVTEIERGLAELWHSAGQSGGKDTTVTQACMSNLLVWCGAGSQTAQIAQEVATVVEHHPARVMLLVPDATDLTADIEAYVAAQCHLSDGGSQVCSEHITVSARRDAARRLPSVARPLLIGDLPTALWWAGSTPPPSGGEPFRELVAMANQIIIDSIEWTEPVPSLVATAKWVDSNPSTPPLLADLAWRRLQPWRRLMSRVLDPAVLPAALDRVAAVEVEHGPHGLTQALYMIGWLASCLGWQSVAGAMRPGVEVTWELRTQQRPLRAVIRRASQGDPELQRLRAAWQEDGHERSAEFRRTGPDRLAATVDGHTDASGGLFARRQPRALLIVMQLPDQQRDPVFSQALGLSSSVAHKLLRA